MTVNLGVTRRIDINTSKFVGLPKIPALSDYERLIARIPELALWIDPANAPLSGSPLLRDRRAGFEIKKKPLDTTTVITPNLVNGLPAIEFDGTAGQGFAIDDVRVPKDTYTVLAVANLNDAGACNIAGGQTEPTKRWNFTYNTGGALRLDHGVGQGADITYRLPLATDGSQWAVLWGSYDSTAGTGAVGINSATPGASAAFADTHAVDGGIYLGALANMNEGVFTCGEFFMFRRAMHVDTQGQNNLSALIAILKDRYGIA